MLKELPVIDLELGAKLLDSNEETAKKMIKDLADMLPKNLQDLKTAYAAKDIKTLGDLAHYVHGGSCYCGAPRLKVAAMALEKQAKTPQSSIQDAAPAFQQLCEEIQAVIDYGSLHP